MRVLTTPQVGMKLCHTESGAEIEVLEVHDDFFLGSCYGHQKWVYVEDYNDFDIILDPDELDTDPASEELLKELFGGGTHESGWKEGDVDRQSGAFTQQEIDDATKWK